MADDPKRRPNSMTPMKIVIYDEDSDAEGEVISDGEAMDHGLPEAKTWRRPDDLKNVDYPEDDDIAGTPSADRK